MVVALQPGARNDGVPRDGEIDLRAVGRAIWRHKWTILIPTVAMAVMAAVGVQIVTPKYRSEARVLYEGRENVFLRPNAEPQNDRDLVDEQAVASQVQLLKSRDLAIKVIKDLKLNERPEFDPVLKGVSPVKVVLGMIGLTKDPLHMTQEERVLESYYERLSVFAVDKSRVIGIDFESSDPQLAARVANAIAAGYLELQQSAKEEQARSASTWLAGEIAKLRTKVADAEARVEAFRSKTNLMLGTNNTTLSTQQLGEFNSQLAAARAQKADADVRARIIRDMLKSGKPIEISDVLNSELMRRLGEQRATVRAQLAEQSSTLLPGHPRIKELRAQLADLDREMRHEAERVARSIENDARVAGARVESLGVSFEQLKRQAAKTNGQDVELRALEREAKAQRDLLESYLAKYREATARDSIGSAPADARIISRATVSNVPAFPKKLPIILIAAIATLLLTTGFVATREILAGQYGARHGADDLVEAPLVPAVPATVVDVSAAAPAPEPPPMPALTAVDDVVRDLRAGGPAARRVAVVGVAADTGASRMALTLGRMLARDARVVLVTLAADSGLRLASPDASPPGLAELLDGRASFADVISRDRLSRLHLIAAGQGTDADLLEAPPLVPMLDALARAYDHVVIDAGIASDLPLEALAERAGNAVLVTARADDPALATQREALRTAGFVAVSVVADAPEPQPVAA